MPAVLRYVPPTDTLRNNFNGEVVKERTVRERQYKEALRYYEGDHDDQLVYDANEEHAVDDNVEINLVKMTADRTATFLFPSLPVIELDPESVEPTEEEEWVRNFIEANGGLMLLNKWALRGFLSGHSFIQVKPPRKARVRKTYPRVSLLDPLTMTIFWNAQDVDEVVWYEQRVLVGDSVHVYDYVHDLDRDTWEVFHYAQKPTETNELNVIIESVTQQVYNDYEKAIDRVLFGDAGWELLARVKHPDVGLPPIIECPHLPHPTGRYGTGEATLKDLQDAVNRIASLRNAIARESGTPVDVVTGAGSGDVERSDDMWVIDNPDASVQRLQLKGDLTSLTTMLEKLIETYLAISRVVLLKGEAKDLQRVTNASVRTLFLDQIAKNGLLQSTYGMALKVIILLGIKMSDLPTRNVDYDPVIKFPNPLPTDYTELANQLSIIYNIGAISKRTVATDMGKNWSFEQVTLEAERKQSMEHQKEQMALLQEMSPEQPEDSDKPQASNSKPPNNKEGVDK